MSLITFDTSRGWRWNWRTELEDRKDMEQDKEQHREQGEAEDVGGEGNHLDQEETEKGRIHCLHFSQRRTARSHQL